MGWLSSCPKRTRASDKRSRSEQYSDDHPYGTLPPVDGAEYLTALFMDTGRFSQAGMGITPITWIELSAFNQCCALELNGWELSRLMDMSRSFCSWRNIGGEQSDIADNIPYINRSLSPTNHLIRQREKAIKREDSPP